MTEINCLTCNHGPEGKDTCGWPHETGNYENPPCRWKYHTNHWKPIQTKKYQSAKVYVIDFHFNSDSKEAISKKKAELDVLFERSIIMLRETHGGDPVKQIFLRKH